MDQAILYTKGEIRLVIWWVTLTVELGRWAGENLIMEPHGFGRRNFAGDRLVQWLWQHTMMMCNSQMIPKNQNKKWTWKSPNEGCFEIDYILTNKKNVIMDVDVMNSLEFESDHRIVRSKLRINHQTKWRHKSTKIQYASVSEEQKERYQSNLEQRKNVISITSSTDTCQRKYDKFEGSVKAASNHLKANTNADRLQIFWRDEKPNH